MTHAKKPSKKSQIPVFNSYQEEASFWDSHSPEDFPGEFEEIEVEFARPMLVRRVSSRARRVELARLLAGLPEGEREAMALNLLGLEPRDIAQVLGWSSDESRRALRSARRRAERAVRA